ncbi:MAG: 50S ribosomal protein L6 [Anaerolineaceae bacterium]
MSRIGRMPVAVPAGVNVDIKGSHLSVKGPKGQMERLFVPEIGITLENGQILVQRSSEEARVRALHGTTRALIHNMVVGVSTGFERLLDIDGVGYRAEMDGAKLVLYVGYSHPVVVEPPEGIHFDVDTKTRQIKISGYDKEQIGQVAANIREIRPPEPYKGKGIRYHGEKIRRKAGKSGKGKK